MEVYFDDLKITHYPSPIVLRAELAEAQEPARLPCSAGGDDYYPHAFKNKRDGLTFNSYQRAGSTDQRWKFQGQEHIDDLGLNRDSFKWRNHQPDIGRFFNVDPLAEKYYYNSPYAFAENKVITFREPEGLEGVDVNTRLREAGQIAPKMNLGVQEYLENTRPVFFYNQPYNLTRNEQGRIVIDDNSQAIEHYYKGNGESVVLGPKTVERIKNSKDVQYYINRIKSGATSGPAEGVNLKVDMTSLSRTFHLGEMTLSYSTTCNDEYCVTSIAVDDKGFVDPNSVASYINPENDDNKGPNHELGGTPYDYDPVKWTITFQNPGYQVDKNGRPKAMQKKSD